MRCLSYTLNTILLTAAQMLMTLEQQYLFVGAWLTVKMLLLVVRIGLGNFAFPTRRLPAVQRGAGLAAWPVFGFIVSVARAHGPLGVLSDRLTG